MPFVVWVSPQRQLLWTTTCQFRGTPIRSIGTEGLRENLAGIQAPSKFDTTKSHKVRLGRGNL